MNTKDISESTNPDLRNSLVAMRRAAELAREIAIRTDTSIVVVRDSKIVHISAQVLREERAARNHETAQPGNGNIASASPVYSSCPLRVDRSR